MYERSTLAKVLTLVAAVLLLLLCGFTAIKVAPALIRGAGERVAGFIRQPTAVAASEPQAQTQVMAVPTEAKPQLAADLEEVNSQELTACQEWGLGVIPTSPVEKWTETMTPSGDIVPSSCVLREADDSNPRGWGPATIPEGVVGHLWLDRGGLKKAITVVGPANIETPYLLSRATFYIGNENAFSGHEGEWVFGIWSSDQEPICLWVDVGNDVIVCDTSQTLAQATTSPSPSATTAPAPTTAPATAPTAVTTASCPTFGGQQTSVLADGGCKYQGSVITAIIPSGWTAHYWDGKEVIDASSSETITTGEASFYHTPSR